MSFIDDLNVQAMQDSQAYKTVINELQELEKLGHSIHTKGPAVFLIDGRIMLFVRMNTFQNITTNERGTFVVGEISKLLEGKSDGLESNQN